MTVYWLMYVLPFLILGIESGPEKNKKPGWFVLCAIFTFLIGLRFEVGGDWISYLYHVDYVSGASLPETLEAYDPGYALFEWLSNTLGSGIYGVNTLCGAIVMTGIYQICQRQTQPWLALTVAVPYLIIVVAMGYTRQSAAIGMELIALVSLSEGRNVRYVILILLAATFHKTASILLPLALVATGYEKVWVSRAVIAGAFVGLVAMIGWATIDEESNTYITNYVEAEMVSEGANIRVAMNAIPAAIFLLFARRIAPLAVERRVWSLVSLLCLASIPLVLFTSTATDRIGLYLLPIQLFVYSRVGSVLFSGTMTGVTNGIIVIGYASALFVLLNYATIVSVAWVPYRNAAFLW